MKWAISHDGGNAAAPFSLSAADVVHMLYYTIVLAWVLAEWVCVIVWTSNFDYLGVEGVLRIPRPVAFVAVDTETKLLCVVLSCF